jgi:hypothetical protein
MTHSTAPANEGFYPMRYLRKDVGVAIIVIVCLLLGLLLWQVVDSRSKTFASQDAPISLTYPAQWLPAESLLDAPVLKVEDPTTPSGFKTTLTVESRELDPADPPTLQTLLDRRVEQRQTLTGYHFLSNSDATVAGQKGVQYQYAYVVQPVDEPRRASLPVVVIAREYIVVGPDRTYYITVAAPQSEAERIGPKVEQIIQSVRLQ